MNDTPPPLAQAVEQCRRDDPFLTAIRGLYAAVDQAVAARGARCKSCGRCCLFEIAGHRLYVSTGELALLLASAPPMAGPVEPGRCPYQAGQSCSARQGRTLGCRAFFCDRELADWSAELYEEYHRQLRRLHRQRGVPYLYVELTAGLAECLGPAGGPAES